MATIDFVCAVCAAPVTADDGILICDMCATRAEHLKSDVEAAREAARAAFERVLTNMDVEPLKRYALLVRARSEARREGGAAWVRFQRRYAATLEGGDALTALLRLEETMESTRRWAQHAEGQIDLLLAEMEMARR